MCLIYLNGGNISDKSIQSKNILNLFQVPFDPNRLVFPPVAAAVLAYCFYLPFVKVLPGGVGLALFSGGLLGYVFYDLTHYYLHHGSPERGSYLHSLKYYHILHHFDDHSTGMFVFFHVREIRGSAFFIENYFLCTFESIANKIVQIIRRISNIHYIGGIFLIHNYRFLHFDRYVMIV